MSEGLKVTVDFEPRVENSSEFKNEWKELAKWCEETLDKIGKAIPEQVSNTFDEMYKSVGTNLTKLGTSLGDTAKVALADSLSPIFHGEMDKVEQIWGGAWDNMVASAQKQLKELQADLINATVKLPYNISSIKKPADDYHRPAVFFVAA